MQSAILFIFAGTIGCTIVAAAVQYACLTMYWYLAVRRRKPSATEQQTAATIETTVPLNAVAATAFVTVRGPANPHSHAEASANSGNVREALHATVTNSERYACMEPQLGELESDDYYCNGEQLAGVLSPISMYVFHFKLIDRRRELKGRLVVYFFISSHAELQEIFRMTSTIQPLSSIMNKSKSRHTKTCTIM